MIGLSEPDPIRRPVNRAELTAAAFKEGILASSYCLEGGLPDDTHVLGVVAGGWAVYFSERGKMVDELFFETGDEACDELLLRLIQDPTTRRY